MVVVVVDVDVKTVVVVVVVVVFLEQVQLLRRAEHVTYGMVLLLGRGDINQARNANQILAISGKVLSKKKKTLNKVKHARLSSVGREVSHAKKPINRFFDYFQKGVDIVTYCFSTNPKKTTTT